MVQRKIIQIDEGKCTGCGVCVPSCAEGAIQIVDGKARVISDAHCDGLGACLGECPEGALEIIEREADAFDEELVQQHLAAQQSVAPGPSAPTPPAGCPGSRVQLVDVQGSMASADGTPARPATDPQHPSQLGHWPVQLPLVPAGAPFFQNADLLLTATCVPFAHANFHERFLSQRAVVIGCPKLDDAGAHLEKLTQILRSGAPKSLTVVHMEVPCCTALVRIAQAAIAASGREMPLGRIKISVRGDVLEETA